MPSVDSWKWFDSRRITHICNRWSKNHTDALQYALFNGDGFESWENVWGTFVGITERDGEQIRRVGSLLRDENSSAKLTMHVALLWAGRPCTIL